MTESTTKEEPKQEEQDTTPPATTAPPEEAPLTTTAPTPPPLDSPPPQAQAQAQAPVPEPEQDSDPRLAQLKALFPDMDDDILLAVLAHDGSVESATNTLLSLNDPNYKPESTTSQFDSDAELARELARQDEEQRQAERASLRSRNSAPPAAAAVPIDTASLTYQAYIPRSRRAPGPTPSAAPQQPSRQGSDQQPAQERDELDQLAEQFNKITEQGKKTFTSVFGAAKQQLNKFNEALNTSASPSTAGTPAPSPPPKGSDGWTPPSALPRPAAQTARSSSSSVVPDLLPRPTPLPALPRDQDLPAVPTNSSTASTSTPAESAPAVPEEPKKDFSKIGLLPRQSVSLLDKKKDQKDEDSDDDDLEYVRSPFDDD